MIPAELIKKIRQIEIFTSRAVNASFAGQYESVFKGRGMEFDEVREYSPGDDIRSIDWNVTARTGRAYIKRFVEEREMTVLLAVDLSGSGDFGTVNRLKNELAAELCAILGFAAARNNDKVGLMIFTDRIELYIPPKKGRSHILRIIRELLCFEMGGGGTDIVMAIDYIAKVMKRKATVFLVSDFIDDGFVGPMGLLNKRHDLVAVEVADRIERKFAKAGLVELEDAESGEVVLVDTSSGKFQKEYEEKCRRRGKELEDCFRSIGVDRIGVSTEKDYINELVKFFHMRHKRY